MNEVLVIYLWGIWDDINGLLAIGILVTIFCGVFIWIPATNINSVGEAIEYLKKAYKIPFIVLISLSVIKTALPSKNVMLLMFTAPKIIELTKQDGDSKQADKIVSILNNSLDYLEKRSKELKEK